jgi:hypothetical protein
MYNLKLINYAIFYVFCFCVLVQGVKFMCNHHNSSEFNSTTISVLPRNENTGQYLRRFAKVTITVTLSASSVSLIYLATRLILKCIRIRYTQTEIELQL